MLKEGRRIKAYIATALENWRKHNEVREWLLASGHEITYDWTTHGAIFGAGLAATKAVAIKEAEGVSTADVVIVLWPGGRGTHVELGMAIALDKPVFLMSAIEAHHKATKETCAFYHHPLVVLSKSFKELYIQLVTFARNCQ